MAAVETPEVIFFSAAPKGAAEKNSNSFSIIMKYNWRQKRLPMQGSL
jgi:hypothetical protein